jgi:hypothetical protein
LREEAVEKIQGEGKPLPTQGQKNVDIMQILSGAQQRYEKVSGLLLLLVHLSACLGYKFCS